MPSSASNRGGGRAGGEPDAALPAPLPAISQAHAAGLELLDFESHRPEVAENPRRGRRQSRHGRLPLLRQPQRRLACLRGHARRAQSQRAQVPGRFLQGSAARRTGGPGRGVAAEEPGREIGGWRFKKHGPGPSSDLFARRYSITRGPGGVAPRGRRPSTLLGVGSVHRSPRSGVAVSRAGLSVSVQRCGELSTKLNERRRGVGRSRVRAGSTTA